MRRDQWSEHIRGSPFAPWPHSPASHSDQLRVAFVSEHASPLALLGGQDAGGQNVYVDEASRQLGRLGIAVDVFTRRDHADVPEVVEIAPQVRVVHVAAGPRAAVPKDDLWPLMPAFYSGMRAFIARERRGYHAAHGHFWMSGWVVAQLRQQLGLPAVQLFHALGVAKQRFQGAADTSPAGRIGVEREIVRAVDVVIAQCPNERAELIAHYDADPDKIALVPAAVNTERFNPGSQAAARSRIGIAPDQPTIVYVGRVLPRKDIRNIVRALALLKQCGELAVLPQLLVVGGATAEPDPIATPEIGALEALAAQLGVADLVRCIGSRDQAALADYYRAADVVVTTPWYEPFGLTPLEAMACARPVIGAAVGGIAYTVVDGNTGFLVPPRDPEALCERLNHLLNNDALRARMGQAARERVEREFTWPLVAQRNAALYRSLVEQSRVPILDSRC